MPDPTRPSREAREACGCWDCVTDGGVVLRDDCIARALDAFAEKWREEAERRQGRWDHLRHHLSTGGRVVGKALDSVLMAVMAITQERDALRKQIRDAINALNTDTVTDLTHAQDGTLRMAMQAHASGVDALRRRVSDLQRRVDHCECESLIDHVRDCLPEYEHDDNAHGESEPFNEIETIEEAGREIDALRRRVAELEAEAQRFYERAVDQLARAEAAEAALDEIIDMDAYEIHEGIVDPQQVAREARRARGEGK